MTSDKQKQSSGHRLEALAGRIFFALVITAVLFGVAELLSRRFLKDLARSRFERMFPVSAYRMPRPYVMFSGRPGAPGLNALGYRGPVPARPKPAGEYRICFLGGSTLVEGRPTIAKLVGRELRLARVPSARTYNFGVISSNSSAELARIVFELADLEPDLIVMYNGVNDIHTPMFWDPRPGYPFNFIMYENHPLLERGVDDYPALALFAYGSNILRTLLSPYFGRTFVPMARTRESVGYMSEGWKEEIVAAYLGNLRKAHRVSRAFGADFMAFFQPTIAFKDKLAKEEEQAFKRDEGEFLRDMRARLVPRFERLSGAGSEEQPEIVDLSLIFKDSRSWDFIDTMHTTQEAKLTIAKAIGAHILRHLGQGAERGRRGSLGHAEVRQ
jgi:hypothetical protein